MIHQRRMKTPILFLAQPIDENMGQDIRLTVIATGFDRPTERKSLQSSFERADVQSTMNISTFTPSEIRPAESLRIAGAW
ncbi:MAG: hypothetical protein R3A45_05590 [Bdellovibrionota bacterium]